MTAHLINTDQVSERYRTMAIDLEQRRLLISNLRQTDQEQGLSEPANCEGFGRVRHFRRATSHGWPPNPLPIDPACKSLEFPPTEILRAQVFQNAVCNWRCWYCFVPYSLLAGSRKHSGWLSASDLIDMWLDEPDSPRVIDLSGGQPDLTPEWIPWMMSEIRSRNLENAVYLWSDDNLSNDFFWRFLSDRDKELVATYPKYGRVCCFKGFSAESFSFNTRATPDLFDRQFALMSRLLTLGIDLYAYATFTGPTSATIADDMKQFVDRLQQLDANLPLRTVPLEVREFTPVTPRLDESRRKALLQQLRAVDSWNREIEDRYSSELRNLNIAEVPLAHCRD
jgi:uncharacterized Fe-S cluster-containing radical SAM superfamily protein